MGSIPQRDCRDFHGVPDSADVKREERTISKRVQTADGNHALGELKTASRSQTMAIQSSSKIDCSSFTNITKLDTVGMVLQFDGHTILGAGSARSAWR